MPGAVVLQVVERIAHSAGANAKPHGPVEKDAVGDVRTHDQSARATLRAGLQPRQSANVAERKLGIGRRITPGNRSIQQDRARDAPDGLLDGRTRVQMSVRHLAESHPGFVTSHIYAVASSVTGSQQGYPTISQREAETSASVRDGETFVIGGLTLDNALTTRTKVPLFGDIPLLGQLFRVDRASKTKTDLYIVITPHIVRHRRFGDFNEPTPPPPADVGAKPAVPPAPPPPRTSER